MENLPEYTITTPARRVAKTLKLKNGRYVKIYEMKGRDVRRAMALAQPLIQEAGNDKATAGLAMMHCQMAVATWIDDLPQTPDTLDELDAEDYQAIFAAYSEGNSTGE